MRNEGRRLLAFYFMDIHTAAKYMSSGYRIRRLAWTSVDYAYESSGSIMGSFTNACTKGEFSLSLSLQDLVLLLILVSSIFLIGIPLFKLLKMLIPKTQRNPLADAKERLEQKKLE